MAEATLNSVTTVPVSATERFEIPPDLGAWAERPLLLQWLMEEVDGLDWSNPQLLQHLRANPGFRPRFLLALIIFAYSVGKYDSEEVVDFFYSEPMLKHLFPTDNPNAKAIRRFRRDYRGLIRWGIVQMLKRSLRHHYELGDAVIPAGLRRLLDRAAANRLESARHFDRSLEEI